MLFCKISGTTTICPESLAAVRHKVSMGRKHWHDRNSKYFSNYLLTLPNATFNAFYRGRVVFYTVVLKQKEMCLQYTYFTFTRLECREKAFLLMYLVISMRFETRDTINLTPV